jgi:protein subunit release factor A
LHRNFSNLPVILDGHIDPVIEALILQDQAERLEALGMA